MGYKYINYYSPSHYVGYSLYPIMVSLNIYFMISSLLMSFKFSHMFYLIYSLMMLVLILLLWGKDISVEGLAGNHNFHIQYGFKLGFFLFLFTEVMFFISIFWFFFDSSLSPSMWIGHLWPSYGLNLPSYTGIPLVNTIILLSSGVTLSISYNQFLSCTKMDNMFKTTLLLALMFLLFQYYEYTVMSISMSDGVFGSIFYFSTGFHMIHVIFGSLFLFYNWVRMYIMHFSSLSHVGLILSIFYWHFVDLVWIFLYFFIYYWGS